MGEQKLTAVVSRLPWREGDGYNWGAETILSIGEHALLFGSGKEAFALAQEVARRWNAAKGDRS